jgi:hypothetical protein
MQYVFAPTKGIPYYAIGSLIYNTVDPIIEHAARFIISASNPSLWQKLAAQNIACMAYAVRLYFVDYTLGRSISKYMASFGYNENMTRALTHSAIAIATSVQKPLQHNKEGKISLMDSTLVQSLQEGSVIFARYYLEYKPENMPTIFLSGLLINFVYKCIREYLEEQQPTKKKDIRPYVTDILLSAAVIDSALYTTSIGLVSECLDNTSVVGKVAINTIVSNIDCLAGHLSAQDNARL